MQNISLFKRCMWLINTVNAYGTITKKQIDYLWSKSVLNTNGETFYHERNFRRHRDNCAEMFGIDINYNYTTQTYSISNLAFDDQKQLHEWLLNSFSVQQIFDDVQRMNKRVVLEYIPSGYRYLTTVLNAMSTSCRLEVTYQGFDRAEPHTFKLDPYCVKVFKQRWYVVGQSDIHEELRVYSLDRVLKIQQLEEIYEIPADFDVDMFFAPFYGVMCGTGTPSEVVRVKVDSQTAKYIRSLPLHHSQLENPQEGFSIFTYYLAPTYDFIQELRTQGSNLEVLEPLWLREKFAEEAKKLSKMYKKTKS